MLSGCCSASAAGAVQRCAGCGAQAPRPPARLVYRADMRVTQKGRISQRNNNKTQTAGFNPRSSWTRYEKTHNADPYGAHMQPPWPCVAQAHWV